MGRRKSKRERKVWERVNIKKKKKKEWISNLKKNHRKIENKKDNEVDADVAQQEHNNNKCYVSVFRDIYIYIYIDSYKTLYIIIIKRWWRNVLTLVLN